MKSSLPVVFLLQWHELHDPARVSMWDRSRVPIDAFDEFVPDLSLERWPPCPPLSGQQEGAERLLREELAAYKAEYNDLSVRLQQALQDSHVLEDHNAELAHELAVRSREGENLVRARPRRLTSDLVLNAESAVLMVLSSLICVVARAGLPGARFTNRQAPRC